MARSRRRPRSGLGLLLVALMLVGCGAPTGAGGSAPSPDSASPSPAPRSTVLATTTSLAPAVTRATTPGLASTMTPALTVAPAAGPAGTIFTIIGTGFSPGATLHALGRNPKQDFALSQPITVTADGTLSLRYNSLGAVPGTYTMAIGLDLQTASQGRVLVHAPFTIAEGGPIPTLTLDPDRGPCTTQEPAILARGHNFPPGAYIGLYVIRMDTNRGTGDTKGTVAADGAFALPVRLIGCDPATADGTQFRITAALLQDVVDTHNGLARATFTVAAAPPALPVVPTPSPDPR